MMNQSDIFKKIGGILNELQEQYEFLAQNPEQLNELELELFLANANFLSDHVEIVRKLNAAKVIKELPQQTEISPKEAEQLPVKPVVPEYIPVVDDLPEPKDYSFFDKPADLVEYVKEEPAEPAPTFEFILNDRPGDSDRFDYEEKKSVDAIFDRPLSQEEARIIAEKQRIREAQLQEPKPQPQPQPVQTTLVPDVPEEKLVVPPAAYFPEDKVEKQVVVQPEAIAYTSQPQPAPAPVSPAPRPTLNDLLAGKSNPSAAASKEASAKAPISSLKGAINLNEKLLYIKDLFNGYNLAYSEAIDLIDKMPDLKTADAFLKNSYAEKNNWQSKQNTVDQFYKLLAQRFPNDQA